MDRCLSPACSLPGWGTAAAASSRCAQKAAVYERQQRKGCAAGHDDQPPVVFQAVCSGQRQQYDRDQVRQPFYEKRRQTVGIAYAIALQVQRPDCFAGFGRRAGKCKAGKKIRSTADNRNVVAEAG